MADSEIHPEYLSPREFARISGLSEVTVRRYVKAGRIPHLQPNGPRGRILIPRDALDLKEQPRIETSRDITDHTPAGPEPEGRGLAGPSPKWMKSQTQKKEE